MDFAKLHRHCQTALLLSLVAALSLCAARAQDSANEGGVPRTDRPEISVSVHDRAGGAITAAGTVKLYRDGILNGSAGLVRGRASFGSIPFGSYTVEVDATGYKPAQRDVNVSVSMRYEVDATLQRDGALRNRGRRQARARGAACDEAAVDEHLAAVVEHERRDDAEADAARVLHVVDQDLVPRIELARKRHRAKAPARPVGRCRRKRHGRRRCGRADCLLQRFLFEHPAMLPRGRRQAEGDRRERSNGRHPCGPAAPTARGSIVARRSIDSH